MEDRKPNSLIIGGSSGLGLQLAVQLSLKYYSIVTGRRDPKNEHVVFKPLDLSVNNDFSTRLDAFIKQTPHIDLLIYAAGFYQKGTIGNLSDTAIMEMVNVGLIAPAMLLSRLLVKQAELPGLIMITSTSQWTPRPQEPIYTAVKAGLGMLANSLSCDE